MALRTEKSGASFRDAKGNVGRISWYVTFDDGAGVNFNAASNINTQLVNIILGNGNVTTNVPTVPVAGGLTNAACIRVEGASEFGANLDPNQYGLAAEYLNAEDKMLLTFEAADHTLHRMSIPSPQVGRFQTDQETVNDADPTVALLFSAVIGHAPVNTAFVSTKTGIAFPGGTGALIGGVLVRRKRIRKLTLWTKDPTLSIPEE